MLPTSGVSKPSLHLQVSHIRFSLGNSDWGWEGRVMLWGGREGGREGGILCTDRLTLMSASPFCVRASVM